MAKKRRAKKKSFVIIFILLLLIGIGVAGYYSLKNDKKPVQEDVYVTISFDTDGGNEVDSQKIKEGGTINLPESTKEGFVLEGWYDGETKVKEATKYTKDTTLKAKWKEAKTFKVSFDSAGGSKVDAITMVCGNKLELPEDPTKKGYTFVNWQDKSGNTIYDGDLLACEDITLTANWEKGKTYTVSFDSKGGSAVSSIKVECEKTLSLPAAPTKSGYSFVAWTDKNGKAILDGALLSCEDIILYADWQKNESETKYYTVTFDSKGGSAVSSIKVECDKTLSLPAAPTKSGYSFVAWTDQNGKAILDGALLSCEDITLYADWQKTENKKEYTCPDGYELKDTNKCVSMKTPEDYCPDGYSYSDKASVCYKYSSSATKTCKDGGYFISGNGTADDKCGYDEVTRLMGNVSGCASEVGGIMLNNHCFRRVEVGSSYFNYSCPGTTSYRTSTDLGGTQNSGCYSLTQREHGCKNFEGYTMNHTYGKCVKTIDATEK